MIGPEVEALDMRMKIERMHQRLGAAAGHAKNDKIEWVTHICRRLRLCPEPMIENFVPGGKRQTLIASPALAGLGCASKFREICKLRCWRISARR